jgi:hypothetical protein
MEWIRTHEMLMLISIATVSSRQAISIDVASIKIRVLIRSKFKISKM